MKKYIFKLVVCVAVLCSISHIEAQELRSSYFMKTALYRHQINPALADQAYMGLLFGNTNIGTRGNVGLSDFIYKLDNNSEYNLTTFMNPNISSEEFLGKLHDKNKLQANANYNILSLGFRGFHGINTLEINVKSNTFLCLPYELFEFMKTTEAEEHYSFKNLGAKSLNYTEIAIGHTQNIGENFRVGAKLKILKGLAYTKLDVKNLDLTLNEDEWSINGDAKFSAAILDSKFKYEENPDPNKTDSSKGQKVTGVDDVKFGMPGFGLALDLGFTYKIPFVSGLTVSGALTDLGSITWKKTNTASSSGTWTFDGFSEPVKVTGEESNDNSLGDQMQSIGDDLAKVFSVYDEGQKSEKSSLMATLSLAAEYQMPFTKKLTVGLLYTKRFDGLYSSNQTMVALNFRPVKFIEASLNMATTSEGTTFGGVLSLYTKGFNLFVGSDSFLGKVSKQYIPLNSGNGNVSFGINFPL